MSRAVRVLKRAKHDLVEIQAYVWRDDPSAAEQLIEDLLRRIERLGNLAMRGSRPRDARLRASGYRYLVHGEYLIFYKVLPTIVRIYRVLHGRRRYGRLV